MAGASARWDPASGGGRAQIIGGKSYSMYSPQWYAAMEEDETRAAQQKGKNAGTQAGTGVNTLKSLVGDLGGGSSSSSSSSSSGSAGGSIGRVGFPGSTSVPGLSTNYVGSTTVPSSAGPSLSPVDTSAADAAQFARAKDQVGEITRSSLVGLRSSLGGRGQLGGGGELRGTARLMEKGAGALGNVARDQAIENVTNERSRALAQFQGDLTMRGQNLSAQQASAALAARLQEVQYQGEITQRGQDLAAQNSANTMAMTEKAQQQQMLDRILNALNPLY